MSSYSSNRGGGRRNNNSRDNNEGKGQQARMQPCRNFVQKGNCTKKNCAFAHVIKLHASIAATSKLRKDQQQNNYKGYNSNSKSKQNYAVASAAIWESPAGLKIFTGGYDGYWRLWNGSGGSFVKEFEHNMGQGGKVHCVDVASNMFYCGFEGMPVSMPDIPVGMTHVWNLSSPSSPPLEFQLGPMVPYAHSRSITCMLVKQDYIVTGSQDASICIWKQDAAKGGFILAKTFIGHAREVTGVVIVGESILWSCSTDKTIRLWDLATGECKYVVAQNTPDAQGVAGGVGHTKAVTSIIHFEKPQLGSFVLSSSLDSTVKVWNTSNAECMASEPHGMGVACITLSADIKGNPLLLCGLENGDIMIRSILQTPTTPAFCLLLKLSFNYTFGHEDGSVKCLRPGPANTFLSGGEDGKLNVWQIAGDFGL